MADEKKENKVKMENLPKSEKELSPEEQKKVKGGAFNTSAPRPDAEEEETQA